MRDKEIPIAVLMQYFRVPAPELPVDYPGRELLLGSRITNISVSGVYVRTSKPLAVGNELDLVFRLPDGKRDIAVRAVVRWRNLGQEAGMGLEFTKVSSRDQKAIEGYVRGFLKRMRKP